MRTYLRSALFLLFFCCAVLAKAQAVARFVETERSVGGVAWQSTKTIVFHLINEGDEPLYISDVEPDCDCTVPDWSRTGIAPGDTAAITVVFDARQLGHFSRSVAVTTSASSEEEWLTLSGVVLMDMVDVSDDYPYLFDFLRVEDMHVDFGDVYRGSEAVAVLRVYNSGADYFTPTLMHLPSYLSVESVPAVLMPGRAGELHIKMRSDKVPSLGYTSATVYLGCFAGDRVAPEKAVSVTAILLPRRDTIASRAGFAPAMEVTWNKEQVATKLHPIDSKGRPLSSFTLHVENKGNIALGVKAVQVLEGNMQVSLSSCNIGAGSSARLKVKFYSGAPSRGRLLLVTDDPVRPKFMLDIEE